ncbi:envelope biogenesis factor ElyC [Limnobaculum parvum]|uniref:Envelope biogenesis factor ElyC n=1 Tax=Limnobaculum parvum TaxID=2172103 RepID=A0A2Y9U1L0_9GAMM|nr:envelope biogenesis factor ElyC [Limnobaculum parvum]AWH89923.1 envelope biogenesis factor ElyC [Limnobaculum parvum]
MLFILKKIIGNLLLPLSFLLLLMALALLLLWFSRWQKSAKTLMTVSWLALLLLSLQPVADRLLMPLENHYATYQKKGPIDYIVVLGGGYTYNPEWAPSANLLSNSLPRVTEGVRLYRQHPGAKMIFTGAAAISNPLPNAKVAAMVAESLGVPEQDIIMLPQAQDTIEEAQAVAQIARQKTLLLVTSANHLPRAMRIFQKEGLNPIPAPANQLASLGPLSPWEKAFPSPIYLSHSERAWYETLGDLWLTVKE